jgi:hypothetical protein
MKSIKHQIKMTPSPAIALCFFCAGILFSRVSFCQTTPNTGPKLSDTLKTAVSNPAVKPDTGKTPASDSGVKHDTLVLKTTPDSLKKNLPPIQPSPGGANVSNQPPAPAPNTMDTTYRFWIFPSWAISAGWGLGSFPLFDEWIKGLPDSSWNIVGPDTALKNFSVKEPADAYTVLWPITIFWTPLTNELNSLSFEGSFFWISKSFQAYLQSSDSAVSKWIHWQQSVSAYSFSFGLTYKYNIPEQYFKVENVNKTSLLLGFSADPLLLVDKSASFSASGLADSTLARVNKALDNRSFRGIGCAWRAGFSSLRRLSNAKGLEISLIYSGSWYGYFKNGNTRTTWKDINPASLSPQENVSFLSNMFQISFALVSGKKPAP